MMALQLVAAVADDQRDRFAPRGADQERQEVTRGTIGPLEVLHDEEPEVAHARCGGQHAPPSARTSAAATPRPQPGPPHARCEREPSGINSASSSRPGATSARSSPSSTRLASERSAPTTGAYGSSPSPSGRHSPTATAHLLALGVTGDLRDQTALPHARLPGDEHDRPDALPGCARAPPPPPPAPRGRPTNRGLETRPTTRTIIPRRRQGGLRPEATQLRPKIRQLPDGRQLAYA